MAHADQIPLIEANQGETPRSWGGGPFGFQKAKVLAALAWHLVKPAEDPELPQCDLTFQENCTAVAEDIMRGSEPDKTPFALAVHRLYLESKQTEQPEEGLANA